FHINTPPTDRPVRVYCDGIYDLFHYGHAKALEQAKKSFPSVHLLVGVCNDELTHEKKGKTVLDGDERAESLRHCRWVDEVIKDAPWVVDQEFLDYHRIDYVAHDDIPYVSVDSDDVYAFVKDQGKFLPTQRTEGVSTSELITRIVRDYDAYLRRNIERGATAKELNISLFKKHEIEVRRNVEEIRESIRKNWSGTRQELTNEWNDVKDGIAQMLRLWDDRSQELIAGFSRKFGVEAVVKRVMSLR
ncbi:hypothetical protein BJ684DRAFT_329, partial [Piptocephalis cylindrospora]